MTSSGRLPNTVRPTRYDLLVAPDLDASTFEGEVAIALDLAAATTEIVLHARELEVHLVGLTVAEADRAASLRLEPEAERVVITTETAPRSLLVATGSVATTIELPICSTMIPAVAPSARTSTLPSGPSWISTRPDSMRISMSGGSPIAKLSRITVRGSSWCGCPNRGVAVTCRARPPHKS